MSSPDPEQRRAHFRLRYPEFERPLFVTPIGEFSVAELSEGGLRLSLMADHWSHGERLAGELRLVSESVSVAGQFLRQSDDEVVLVLDPGVSLRHMLLEQKRLIRKYPALYGPKSRQGKD